jgi:hypothetical protein
MTIEGMDSAGYTIRVLRLGEEPRDDLRECMTTQERIRLLRRLSERAWALGGKPVPRIPRSRMPIVVTTLK